MSDSLQDHDLSMEEPQQDEVVVDDLPAEPTEQQLRDAYDNDEIDRFLRLFTTVTLYSYGKLLYIKPFVYIGQYVQEVTVLDPDSGSAQAETLCEDRVNSGDVEDKTSSHKTTEEEHFNASIPTRSICEGIAKVC